MASYTLSSHRSMTDSPMAKALIRHDEGLGSIPHIDAMSKDHPLLQDF